MFLTAVRGNRLPYSASECARIEKSYGGTGRCSLFYIIYGEDDFLVKELVAQVKADCGGADLGEANTSKFEGSKLHPNELVAACNTISFLAPKRLVIVEGLLSRFDDGEKRRSGKNASRELQDWSGFAEHVSSMPESSVLVLVDGKLSRTNPLLKTLSPLASVRECKALKGSDLQNWIRDRTMDCGGRISPQALLLLADLIGSNLWILSNEIGKLCLYAGERPIEVADIHAMVSYAREANIFTMVDAIVQHNRAVASRLMHQLMDEGSAPPYLLYMITRQFRLLVQARTLMEQRLPASVVGSKLGLSSDYVLQKALEQARGYSMERLERTYRKLLEADLSIKTGSLEGILALDLLVADLCQE